MKRFAFLLLCTALGVFPMSLEAAQTPAEPSEAAIDLHTFLPELDEIDGEWIVQGEGERTREDVIELLGRQGDELIDSLGWRANAFRNFVRTNVTDPGSFYEPVHITVSIHAFADSDGADDALWPLSKWVADIESMEVAQEDGFGDRALAFSGLDGRLPAFVIYVQVGNLVIRVGAFSMLGEPRDMVIDVTELVLEKVTA